jgi:hypothetical protein
MPTVQVPVELLEAVAAIRLPEKIASRLQSLMDRNTDGLLTEPEREELEALAELSERLALLRALALRLLGRKLA